MTAMQGTVATFDETSRSGHVLTDDGVPLDYPAESLADHIRHLRVGQRVFVELSGDTVTSIAIWQRP
jgi:2-phospho-L-lactate guanylyltransferase